MFRITYEGDVTNPLSLNLYTYVKNNPLKYTDPTGHNQAQDTGGFGGLPSPFGGYAGTPSDKGLISALLALMFPFYYPAPAQEPTIILWKINIEEGKLYEQFVFKGRKSD